ncbi:MAG: hypothetical protein HZC22_13255 [Rhodocyclales bacterium]|nr:hypothetical protein [Rhodocyclales bacterium]
MSRLQQQLATDLRHEQESAWAILSAASPNLSAAEILEMRLREAGFDAAAQGHLDEHGCVALVFARADRDQVLPWLDHYAITYQPVSSVDTDSMAVHTYAAYIAGSEVSLAICMPRGEVAPS